MSAIIYYIIVSTIYPNHYPIKLRGSSIQHVWDHATWMIRKSRYREEWDWEDAGVAPEDVQILKQRIGSMLHSGDGILSIHRVSANEIEIRSLVFLRRGKAIFPLTRRPSTIM